jgi:hypothetical protein
MSMGDNDMKYPELKMSTNIDKVGEKDRFVVPNVTKTMNLDQPSQAPISSLQPNVNFVMNKPKRKRPVGFKKFFEKNKIKIPISQVGRNKNIRFGPDGVYRSNRNKTQRKKLDVIEESDTKKKQEEILNRQRRVARLKMFMKNRNLEGKDNKENSSEPIFVDSQDMMHPLQNLVLLDSEIASSLFFNLFECLFDREPKQVIKDAIAEEAIKILKESVA